jgi:hypothetical protein
MQHLGRWGEYGSLHGAPSPIFRLASGRRTTEGDESRDLLLLRAVRDCCLEKACPWEKGPFSRCVL